MKKSRKFGIILITVLAVTTLATMLAFAGCSKDVVLTFMNGDAVHSTVKGLPGDEIALQTAPETTGY